MPGDTTSFAAALTELGVRLPLRLCDEEIGSVLDADGMEVFVVDANSDLNDESATAIAELFVDAINAHEQVQSALEPFAKVADEWDRWQAMGSTSSPTMLQLRYGQARIGLKECQAARSALASLREGADRSKVVAAPSARTQS